MKVSTSKSATSPSCKTLALIVSTTAVNEKSNSFERQNKIWIYWKNLATFIAWRLVFHFTSNRNVERNQKQLKIRRRRLGKIESDSQNWKNRMENRNMVWLKKKHLFVAVESRNPEKRKCEKGSGNRRNCLAVNVAGEQQLALTAVYANGGFWAFLESTLMNQTFAYICVVSAKSRH